MIFHQEVMGSVLSFTVPDKELEQSVLEGFLNILRTAERRFSVYLADSELSRYNQNEIKKSELSQDFGEVMNLCDFFCKKTDGYFSAYFNKEYNPTGLVKGWAIEKAAQYLLEQGCGTFLINIGGDILAKSNTEKVWKIVVQNPFDKNKVIAVLNEKNIAVATSGIYERGEHIINPKTQQVVNTLTSLTVIGPSIIEADVYATACFAMGEGGLAYLSKQTGYRGLQVAGVAK